MSEDKSVPAGAAARLAHVGAHLLGAAQWRPQESDTELLGEHLRATVKRYSVAGVVALGAAPVVYSLVRLCAMKKRVVLVNLASSVEQRHHKRATVVYGEDEDSDSVKKDATQSPTRTGSPRRQPVQAQSAGSPMVGSVKVSYSDDPSKTKSRLHVFVEGRADYIMPLTRTVLNNQRATDAEFATACAHSAASVLLWRSAVAIAKGLATDIAVHIVVFGFCALVDSTSNDEAAMTMENASAAAAAASSSSAAASSDPTTHGVAPIDGSTASTSSFVLVLARNAVTYLRYLVVDLATDCTFKADPLDGGRAAPTLSAYGLYDFAHSVSSPFERCWLPRWAAVARHALHTLLWLGRPCNPLWKAAETAGGGGPAVDSVWRSLTPKGYFVYFLLRWTPMGTLRRRVRSIGRRVVRLARHRYDCRALADSTDSDSAADASRTDASSTKRSGLQAVPTGSAGARKADGSGSAPRRHQPLWMRPFARVRLGFSLVIDLWGAFCMYVVASTLTFIDGVITDEQGGALLRSLRGGGGLSFHALGILTGFRKVLWFVAGKA